MEIVGNPLIKSKIIVATVEKCKKVLLKIVIPLILSSPPPPHDDDTVAFDKIFAKNNVSLKDRCLALSGEFFLNFWIILLLFGIPFGILGTSLSSDQMTLLFLVQAILFIALRPIFYASKKKGIFGALLGISLKTDYNESISLKRYIMRIAVKVMLIFILTAIGYILTISLFIADSKFGTPIFSRALLPFLGFGGIPIFLYFISFFLSKKSTPRLFYDKWLGVYVQKTTVPKWRRVFAHIFIIVNVIIFILANISSVVMAVESQSGYAGTGLRNIVDNARARRIEIERQKQQMYQEYIEQQIAERKRQEEMERQAEQQRQIPPLYNPNSRISQHLAQLGLSVDEYLKLPVICRQKEIVDPFLEKLWIEELGLNKNLQLLNGKQLKEAKEQFLLILRNAYAANYEAEKDSETIINKFVNFWQGCPKKQ